MPQDTPTLPRAQAVVQRYSLLSLGVALVPVPVLDLAALSGLQLAMIRELARLYGVRFRKHRARHLISALLGGSSPTLLALGLDLYSLTQPGARVLVNLAGRGALNSAATYALGRAFILHFETGGDFLDFDPRRIQAHFQQQQTAPGGEMVASFAGIRP